MAAAGLFESDAAASVYYRQLEVESLPREEYCLLSCFCHCFYAPLWLAGPIVSANGLLGQLRSPRVARTRRASWLLGYALRLALCLVLLELLLALAPVYALTASGALRRLPPRLLFVTTYSLLLILWLKFVVIWRFARLWALLDGVETLENLPRCVSSHYSLIGFWRDWHCSFNRWLVRELRPTQPAPRHLALASHPTDTPSKLLSLSLSVSLGLTACTSPLAEPAPPTPRSATSTCPLAARGGSCSTCGSSLASRPSGTT